MDVHDRGPNPVCNPERPLELDQGSFPDIAKGRAEGDEPGRVRHNAQAVAIKSMANSAGVDLVGIGGRRLQGEVHEVEPVLANPLDFFQRVAGRVVHRTDLH